MPAGFMIFGLAFVVPVEISMMEKLKRLQAELNRLLGQSQSLVYEILDFIPVNDGRLHLDIRVSADDKRGAFRIELSIGVNGNAITGVNPGDAGIDAKDPLAVALVSDLYEVQSKLNGFIDRGFASEPDA